MPVEMRYLQFILFFFLLTPLISLSAEVLSCWDTLPLWAEQGECVVLPPNSPLGVDLRVDGRRGWVGVGEVDIYQLDAIESFQNLPGQAWVGKRF